MIARRRCLERPLAPALDVVLPEAGKPVSQEACQEMCEWAQEAWSGRALGIVQEQAVRRYATVNAAGSPQMVPVMHLWPGKLVWVANYGNSKGGACILCA